MSLETYRPSSGALVLDQARPWGSTPDVPAHRFEQGHLLAQGLEVRVYDFALSDGEHLISLEVLFTVATTRQHGSTTERESLQ
jgi:hypothetical protein